MCDFKRHKLVMALIEAGTVARAAALAGCSRATAFRMAKAPGFLQEFDAARRAYTQTYVQELARRRAEEVVKCPSATASP
jgi:hypothetical protein